MPRPHHVGAYTVLKLTNRTVGRGRRARLDRHPHMGPRRISAHGTATDRGGLLRHGRGVTSTRRTRRACARMRLGVLLGPNMPSSPARALCADLVAVACSPAARRTPHATSSTRRRSSCAWTSQEQTRAQRHPQDDGRARWAYRTKRRYASGSVPGARDTLSWTGRVYHVRRSS